VGDPKAEELYKAAQAGSAVLEGRGSGVSQAELEELRAAAGR
jgi:hypothetical protein